MGGSLPWSGLDAKTMKELYRKIMMKKESTSLDALFEGFPEVFEKYLTYCRSLNFTQRPDYAMLQGLFKAVGAGTAGDLPWCCKSGDELELPRYQAVAQPDDPIDDAKAPKQWACLAIGGGILVTLVSSLILIRRARSS